MLYKIKTIKISLNVSDASPEKINTPKAAYELALELFKSLDADQEQMILFSLDSQNQIRGYKIVSLGGQCSADPDFKVIFRSALLLGAVSIILAHNHPSGETEPSKEDVEFTRKVKEAGDLISIKVLDHIIIGTNGYYSFEERS